MNQFREIEELKSKLDSCRPLTSAELKRLRDEFLVDFTYNSNAIEGNTLTLQETALVLKEGITIGRKPLQDHLEVVGHRDAFCYIEDLVKEKTPLSESIIKDIHSLVLMDRPQEKGRYRRIPVTITGAVNVSPQPYIIPKLMEELIDKYNTKTGDKHIIEKVSLFHLEFETIHPFIDGNGRTGRLILNLELMREGYPPINIKFQDRGKYYDCFAGYHNQDNPDMLTNLIREYVKEELNKYILILESAKSMDHQWEPEMWLNFPPIATTKWF